MPDDHAVHDLRANPPRADIQVPFSLSLFWQIAINLPMTAEVPDISLSQ
jgi:hypothetical protein